MTETLITASTVLVPVFLLIPLLGKYVDMKQTAIQAARYEAWEYTVYYGNNSVQTFTNPTGERPGGYFATTQPVKTPAQMQVESRKRFFSDYNRNANLADLRIASGDFNNTTFTPSTLWFDHRQQPLWDGTTTTGSSPRSSEATPDLTGGVFNTIIDIIDGIFSAVAEIASHLTNSGTGFTIINMDGLAESDVGIQTFPPAGLIDFVPYNRASDDAMAAIPSLTFSGTASVLTDTWNAGGLEHTTNQVGGLVPTKILADLLEPAQGAIDVIATLLAAFELRGCNASPDLPDFLDPSDPPGSSDGSLWLGYINIDAVHPDRLESGGAHDCPDGICVLDPEPGRSDCDT